MHKDDGQQKLLAIILIVLSIFVAWFFLLRPAWQESGELKKSLSKQEQIVSQPSVWSDNLEEEAKEFSLVLLSESLGRAVVRGKRKDVLSLAASSEENNVSLVIKEKGNTFILEW